MTTPFKLHNIIKDTENRVLNVDQLSMRGRQNISYFRT